MRHTLRVALFLAASTFVALSPVRLAAQQLYWSQFGPPSRLGRVNLNGSSPATLNRPTNVFGMETLDTTRQVYWIDNAAKTIMRANADFTEITTVVMGLGAGTHLNLALDPAANLIFWSNSDSTNIGRANLSGGPIVGTFTSPGIYPDDLAVDPVNQLLYWTTQTGEIVRSQYDGSGLVILFTLGSGLGSGSSGLDLDLARGKMYLTDPNKHAIRRANLNGSNLETLLTFSTERPFGMALFNGRMYWTDLDGGRLRSANLDGTNPMTILSGLSFPRQVSIMANHPLLAIQPDGSGGYFIRFTANPGSTWRLQRASALSGPWTSSAPQTAPSSGMLEFMDRFPTPGQGFYRTVQP